MPLELPRGKNPPDGAMIDYYFGSAPAGEVTLEILDSKNQVVRRFSTNDRAPGSAPPLPIADAWLTPPARFAARAGMNRFVWDLRYPSPSSEIDPGSETGRADPGVQVLPGIYQVKLTAGGRTYSQPLKVTLDPRSTATALDLSKQLDLGLKAAKQVVRSGRAIREQPESGRELRNLNREFGSVLQVVNSADRTPPAQAYAVYEEASQALERILAKGKPR